jgi:hypothetical protein
VDATLPDEWVRCAKRGDKHALELLATAIDPSCDWRPEVRARALLVVWKRVQDPAAKESVRVALESLASANDALGVTIHKWAMTLSGEAHLLALNRADGAADRAEGKAASRLGSIALEEHDYPTAARWFRRAAESGCPGGYCGLYQLSQRDPSVVTREEGADALAAAVAAEDCVALVWQSLLHEDEGDDERAIYLADLAVAAARRDGVSSIRYALLAVRLRFGRNVLHGFMRTPTAPSGSAAQQLRDAIFSEFTNDYVLVRRAIVQLGYVLAHEGRAIPDELNERIVDLASHGYRPAITLARPLRIRFVCASNQLANLDHGPLPLDRTLNWMRDVCIELQTRLARDPVDADTFWNATRASQDLETVARLDKDVAVLSLRAQLANALGRKIERDSLLEQWERLIETLPHWRQSEERERCLVARARYALFDRGPVPKIRVSPKSHPATLFYAATMLGAMGRTDYGKWVLGFLDEQDKEPAKTSLLRAEFEAQDGDPDEGDTLKCFDLIDDRSAKPIDRQRACRVFVDRASTAEMARRIPNLRSASAVSMLARSMLVAKRAPTPEVMTACAQHYFSRQHAEAYMDALVDLIRALLWASYCSCNRTDFLSLLACVGTAAHERASTGELHPGMVRKLITARPETWLRMFDAVSWSKALDAIDSALDRVGSGSAQDAKLIVRDIDLPPSLGPVATS